MALAQGIKKGGPYTKEEKEERRKQVYKMHFEQGKSAVKISEILGVNRNTISDDIRYWYSELSQEIRQTNFSSHVISIIHEFELQRSRLLDELEKAENFEDKMRIERFLYDINSKLGQVVTKLMTSEKRISVSHSEELDENEVAEIREFVRYLIFEVGKYRITEDEIKNEYILKTGCNKHQARTISSNMSMLGLDECEIVPVFIEFNQKYEYNIVEFASMCEYITLDELAEVRKRYK